MKKYENDLKDMPKEELKSSVKSIEVSFLTLVLVFVAMATQNYITHVFVNVFLFVTMQNLLDEFAQWEKRVDDILTEITASDSQEAPEDFANVQELVQVLLTAAAQGKNAILVSPINCFIHDLQISTIFFFISIKNVRTALITEAGCFFNAFFNNYSFN